jgi:hypothetical protein
MFLRNVGCNLTDYTASIPEDHTLHNQRRENLKSYRDWGCLKTALRRIFGPKRDEISGSWRKLHNEELRNLYYSPDIIRMIKSRRIRWRGHVSGMGEKCI